MSATSIRLLVAGLVCAAGALAGAAPVLAQAAEERGARVTRTSEGYVEPRGDAAGDTGPAAGRGWKTGRVPAAEVVTKPRDAMSRTQSAAAGDHWVYDAFVELDGDLDGDGYFHFLHVTFDVDSLYAAAYVFAEIYVSADGTNWEHLYTTDDFLVEGQKALDEYEVETELVSGYPRGYYDVLVEIYDADYVEYVDEFGPAQSPAMSLLPLEDMYADGVPRPPQTVVDEHGGGGAALWLALLGALVPLRRARLRPARA